MSLCGVLLSLSLFQGLSLANTGHMIASQASHWSRNQGLRLSASTQQSLCWCSPVWPLAHTKLTPTHRHPTTFIYYFFLLVPLSAHAERFSVSFMRDLFRYYFKICYFIQVSPVDNPFLRDMTTGMISYIIYLTAFQSRSKNILVTPLLGILKGWCLVLGTDHTPNFLNIFFRLNDS